MVQNLYHPPCEQQILTVTNRAIKDVYKNKNLSLASKAVYVFLSINSQNGRCSMGTRLIAETLNVHRNTLLVAVKELEDAKVLSVSRSDQERNVYILNKKAIAKVNPKEHKCKEAAMLSGLAICPKCKTVVDLERDGFARKAIA